jgi:hypothetical protein
MRVEIRLKGFALEAQYGGFNNFRSPKTENKPNTGRPKLFQDSLGF